MPLYRPNRAAKLDWPTVQRIRELYAEGFSQGRISREFGISVAQIGRIVRHEAWVGATNEPPADFDAGKSISAVEALLKEVEERKEKP